MGMDFRAVMGHRLSKDELFHIPDKLNDLEDLAPLYDQLNLGSVIFWSWREPFQNASEFSDWLNHNLAEDGVVYLRAANAIWICFSEHMAELGTWVRWHEFVKAPGTASALRKICVAIGEVLGADKIAYIPDSGWTVSNRAGGVLFENGRFEEFEAILRSSCPPEETVSEKMLAGGYFIEPVLPNRETAASSPHTSPDPSPGLDAGKS
jgi:hypothetical protein